MCRFEVLTSERVSPLAQKSSGFRFKHFHCAYGFPGFLSTLDWQNSFQYVVSSCAAANERSRCSNHDIINTLLGPRVWIAELDMMAQVVPKKTAVYLCTLQPLTRGTK